jgi:hypothetical protein
MNMKKLLVLLLLLYPLSALAVTYEWTDQHGTVNFADDLGNVPKKYRKKAKVIGAEDSGVPQVTETTEPLKGKAKTEEAKGKLYDGKDEKTWHKDLLAAKNELLRADSDLKDLRARLNDTSKMSRSEYLSITTTIKNSEIKVQQLQKKLNDMRDTAERLGVPGDIRQ